MRNGFLRPSMDLGGPRQLIRGLMNYMGFEKKGRLKIFPQEPVVPKPLGLELSGSSKCYEGSVRSL